MTEHPSDAFSAYLDDELDAGARAGLDAHLASCAACRSVVAELDELRTRAGAWHEAEVSPAMDLWPGIAARLEPRRANVVAWHRRRWSVGVAELAVAASLVAGLSAALLWRGGASPAAPAAGPAPIVAQAEPTDVPDVGVTRVVFADAQFDAAVVDLERVLREQRDRLNPRTVLVLERNLSIIDVAIREAREALATDPANSLLNAHLADARRRKLDLLRRAAQITGGD